ncbi:hypothetical protein HF576_16425 [Microbacterium sp. CFH 90308]|uniref:Uncharacterized protein n=1 Tax=Microbacterium salsuginis TaxID=2722803 RepID=A0ABX1KH28_9MICO|nr:hypothetical protein [Microbacterium sp. CFH 90308]NLP85434.1 hypothetical protein [Microbacterium sp. CFH 90308]
MGRPAPKPANWNELVAAWNNPEEFEAQRRAYLAMVGAQRAQEARDWTEANRGQE